MDLGKWFSQMEISIKEVGRIAPRLTIKKLIEKVTVK